MSNSSINDSSSSQWVRRCGGMCEKEIISTDDIIRCSGFCKKFFHNKCTSLTPTVIKELNKGATVFFRCNECSDYDAKFVQYFESLTMQLVKIEKSNSTLKDYVQSRFDDMEKKFESSEKVLVDGVKKVDEKMSFSNVLKNTATSDGVPTIVNKGKKKKKASLFIPAASPSSGADKMSRDEIKSVSSASSNLDENGTSNSNNQSSGVFSSSANENLFSMSEDTPQNSPMKTIPLNNTSTPSSSKPVQKKLSHSSVATDVSFRLPHSDHQPINSPQSDWESASLVAEDSSITSSVGVQLEQISKEDIYKAYTEIKQQYRELKLEQQALRLEMDNLQCVVKTLKTKLELPGEKPDSVLNGSLSSSLKEEPSLITLSSDNDTSNEYVKLEGKESKVKKFEANMKLQLSEALSSTLKSLKTDLEAIVKKETAQLLDEIESNSQKHEKELNATKTDSTNFSITLTTPSSPRSNSTFDSSHDSGFASTPNTSLTPITINVSPIRSTSTTQNPLVAGRNHSSSPGTCSTAHNTGHNRQPYQPYQEGDDYIMQDGKFLCQFEPCLTKEDRPCFETREKFQHHASKRHNFKPCQTCHEQVRSGDFKKHGEKHKSDDTKRLLN